MEQSTILKFKECYQTCAFPQISDEEMNFIVRRGFLEPKFFTFPETEVSLDLMFKYFRRGKGVTFPGDDDDSLEMFQEVWPNDFVGNNLFQGIYLIHIIPRSQEGDMDVENCSIGIVVYNKCCEENRNMVMEIKEAKPNYSPNSAIISVIFFPYLADETDQKDQIQSI